MAQVVLKNSNGWIQLVFRQGGKRRYLSIGLRWDKPNCALAKLKAAQIEQDILFERFVSIEEHPDYYKVGGGEKRASNPVVVAAKLPNLPELWAEYIEYKRPKLAPSSLYGPVRSQTALINRAPCGLEQQAKLRDWIERESSPSVGARLVQALNACCRWAVEVGRLESNPMAGLKISLPKNSEKEIDPFTAEERDLVLEAIAGGQYWKHYHRLIAFLFATGCRPSEAIALEWGDVAKDGKSLTFQRAATLNEQGQLRAKPGLKSQQRRKIPLNEKVLNIIGVDDGECSLIFPALGGGLINTRNMAKRCWKPALAAAGVGDRNLYQCRHTFITLALQSGMQIQDIARIVGNSPGVILKHYAGVSRLLELPEV